MQRNHFKKYSQEYSFNQVTHKRVFSQMSGIQSKHYLGINIPTKLSIKQYIQDGLFLLMNFIEMKQILQKKLAMDALQSAKPYFNPGLLPKDNFRNNSRSNFHKRNLTIETQKGLQRANLISEIIAKLHSKDKGKYNSKGKEIPSKTLLEQSQVNQVQGILKPVNSNRKLLHASTNQSNFYHQKDQPCPRFYTKQSQAELQESLKYLKGKSKFSTNKYSKTSIFKSLKNEITHVKQKFQELKKINQQYRKQNQMHRMKSAQRIETYPYLCCHQFLVCHCSHDLRQRPHRRNMTSAQCANYLTKRDYKYRNNGRL